jgi:hypothetical protein
VEDDEEYAQVKDTVLDGADELEEGMKAANEATDKVLEDSNASTQRDDARQESRDAKQQQRLADFLHDTETTVKIFFSAYWRDKGLAWSVPISSPNSIDELTHALFLGTKPRATYAPYSWDSGCVSSSTTMPFQNRR